VSSVEVLEAVAKRTPEDIRITLRRGQILLMEENPEEALDYLQRAVLADPGSPESHFCLGQALYLMSRGGDFGQERVRTKSRLA
jgi:predicted Zn-dependent protease